MEAQTPAPGESEYKLWQSRQAAVKALLQKYPNDFFVQRDYVDSLMGSDPSTGGFPSEKGTLQAIAEYKALHEKHPDDAVVEYLYATTLIDRDTPTAIKLIDDALQKQPSLPQPNLDLVRIYTSPNFLDRAKAESHLSAYLAACPADPNAHFWLRSMGNDDFTQKAVVQFRNSIQSKSDLQSIVQFQTLWALEFKLHPRADYPALRKQVAADLARIRALNMQDKFGWWRTLGQGYQLLGDADQQKWAEAGTQKAFESANSAQAMPDVNQWFKDRPRPKPDATKEERQAYQREILKQTDQWIQKYPDQQPVWADRMDAMSNLDDVPPAECAATLEKRLQLEQADAGTFPLYWPTYFDFDAFLSQKHIDPALEVKLARKGFDTIVVQWENIPATDLNSTKDDLDYWPNFYWPMWKSQALIYEADGYTRLNQPSEALAALGKAKLQLQALNSDMTADESRRQLQNRDTGYYREEFRYWQVMARLAQSQSRDTDAMAYYQSALVDRFDSDNMPSPDDQDPLRDDARKLWAKLGGTEQGWNSWYGDRAEALAKKPQLRWEIAQEPLPSFRLTDLQGKTWQLADLKGKVVFLNFWASW